jgi:hypothetical protein
MDRAGNMAGLRRQAALEPQLTRTVDQEAMMGIKNIPGAWEAVLENGSWVIRDKDGRKIAVVEKGKNAKANARLIAMSPYIHEALKGLVGLIGDEDLEDNGELSGAAVCDMARAAVALITG